MKTAHLRGWLLVAALGLGGCATAELAALNQPVIPFQTRFSHWDHHWFLWTPEHPTYESIEVASRSRGAGPDLVWAWFTERAEGKKQVHYFNDGVVAGSVPGSYYRVMEYRTQGEVGAPLDLYARFADKDDAPVEWSVRVDRGRGFDPQGAGLTDPSGHGANRFFLVFFRERNQRTTDSRLTIGDRDYSFPRDPAIVRRFPFQAAYSFNVFSAIVPYAQGRVETGSETIKLPSAELLQLQSHTDATTVYGTEPSDARGAVSVEVTPGGELWTYTQKDRDHIFRVTFDPPLPTITGGQTRYRMAFDEFDGAVEGMAVVRWGPSGLTVDWRPERPEWATAYPLRSTLTNLSSMGYDISVAPANR